MKSLILSSRIVNLIARLNGKPKARPKKRATVAHNTAGSRSRGDGIKLCI